MDLSFLRCLQDFRLSSRAVFAKRRTRAQGERAGLPPVRVSACPRNPTLRSLICGTRPRGHGGGTLSDRPALGALRDGAEPPPQTVHAAWVVRKEPALRRRTGDATSHAAKQDVRRPRPPTGHDPSSRSSASTSARAARSWARAARRFIFRSVSRETTERFPSGNAIWMRPSRTRLRTRPLRSGRGPSDDRRRACSPVERVAL